MVSYQGPEAIRGLVESTQIPIFNRVSQINYSVNDLNAIKLDRSDVSRMRELRQITVTKKYARPLNDTEAKVVGQVVPPCRLASVEKKSKGQIDVKVKPASPFACAAQ